MSHADQNPKQPTGSTAGPIYWALDPYFENTELNKKAAMLATIFAAAFDDKIQTVTVLSPEQLNWPSQLSSDWESRFREGIARKTEEFISSSACDFSGLDDWRKRLNPPLLLSQSESSLRRSVGELVKNATDASARMIVAATHARKGMSRLALGSFCETLASASSVPVALVNAHTVIEPKIKTVVFPTDLGENSKKRLLLVTAFAKSLGARLRLWHKLLTPYPSLVEPGYLLAGTDLGTVESVFAGHRDEQAQVGAAWRDEVTRQGVTCELVFSSSPGSILESLLIEAKDTPASLIMIPDQTGPLASMLLGHVSRGLARDSIRPVIILPFAG